MTIVVAVVIIDEALVRYLSYRVIFVPFARRFGFHVEEDALWALACLSLQPLPHRFITHRIFFFGAEVFAFGWSFLAVDSTFDVALPCPSITRL